MFQRNITKEQTIHSKQPGAERNHGKGFHPASTINPHQGGAALQSSCPFHRHQHSLVYVHLDGDRKVHVFVFREYRWRCCCAHCLLNTDTTYRASETISGEKRSTAIATANPTRTLSNPTGTPPSQPPLPPPPRSVLTKCCSSSERLVSSSQQLHAAHRLRRMTAGPKRARRNPRAFRHSRAER